MPIYTYYCRKCKYTFEAIRNISDREIPATCPKCGGEATLTKTYMGDGVTFRFKGPGFYDTDYRIK